MLNHKMSFTLLPILAVSLLSACGGSSDPKKTAADSSYTGERKQTLLTSNDTRELARSFSESTQLIENTLTVIPGMERDIEDGNVSCKHGGTFTKTSNLDEKTNLGTITVKLAECATEPSVSLNGTISVRITVYDDEYDYPTDATLSIKDLSILQDTVHYTLTGTIHYIETSSSDVNKLDLLVANSDKQTQLYFKNYKRIDSFSADDSDSLSGQLFDSKKGYIDISSSSDFVWDAGEALPEQGYIYIDGEKGSKASLSFPSEFPGNMKIQFDEDGDGEYEKTELVIIEN